MRKTIKKYGNSFIINLSPEDMKNYGLEAGDLVHLTITEIDHPKIKPKKGKKK